MSRRSAAIAANLCVARPTWAQSRRDGKISQRLARQIVSDITEHGLEPGDLFGSEPELAERYEVGRATLREALQLLESQGVVTAKRGPKGGIFVAEATAQDFARMARLHLQARGATYREVAAARRTIEPLLARLAAETADEEARAELDEVMAEAERIDPADDVAFFQNLSRFHTTVAGMTRNVVYNAIATIVQEVHDARWNVSVPAERKARALAVHAEIAAAIRRGEGDTAEQLMREHVEESDRIYERSQGDERVRWA